MRRAFLFFAFLLCAGCTQNLKTQSLPPEEVLKRAVIASENLESASFDLHASFESASAALPGFRSGALHLAGFLRDSGRQVAANGDLALGGTSSMSGNLALVAAPDGVYVSLHNWHASGAGNPLTPLLSSFSGSWLHFPRQETGVYLSPDASMLRLQVQAIRIEKDDGITDYQGYPVYHYDVALDSEKLLEQNGLTDADRRDIRSLHAIGEIWIDAHTFFLRRAVWRLAQVETPFGKWNGTADMTLQDQNAVSQEITLPPVSMNVDDESLRMFHMISSGALLPQMPKEVHTQQ